MARYGMVINLHKCVGCGSCGIACKSENNVPKDIFWAHHLKRTTGTFPNVRYEYVPTLCNHCDNAACVKACPTKAMYKDEKRLTLHDTEKCIGCKSCMQACPYGVISFNQEEPHAQYRDTTAIIPGCVATGQETAQKTGEKIPYYNPDRAATYPGIRPKGVVEKCTLCDHRLANKEQPWCVVSCAAQARIAGDLDDPNSEVSKLLAKYPHRVLRSEKGTKPKVFYVRNFSE